MKITKKISNRHRTLSAVPAAGGMMTPLSASAAALLTNLVVNPGFENVDLGVTSPIIVLR